MISVVVPVYNVESYLHECVESLVNQTCSELEIILVNDGSTDKSGAMCDEWAKKDSRIIVIHKENGGSGARSAVVKGVEKASGEYLCFLDSDDYYRLNACEVMLDNIVKYNADSVQFAYVYVNKQGKESTLPPRKFTILEGEAIDEQILSLFFNTGKAMEQYSFGRTDKIYKTSIVKKAAASLNHKINIYEDFEMSLHITKLCSKIVILPDSYLYCWRYVDGSVSRRVTDKTLQEHQNFVNEMRVFATQNNYPVTGIDLFTQGMYADLVLQALTCNASFSEKVKQINKVMKVIDNKAPLIQLASRQMLAVKFILILSAKGFVKTSVFLMSLAKRLTNK